MKSRPPLLIYCALSFCFFFFPPAAKIAPPFPTHTQQKLERYVWLCVHFFSFPNWIFMIGVGVSLHMFGICQAWLPRSVCVCVCHRSHHKWVWVVNKVPRDATERLSFLSFFPTAANLSAHPPQESLTSHPCKLLPLQIADSRESMQKLQNT